MWTPINRGGESDDHPTRVKYVNELTKSVNQEEDDEATCIAA